FSAPAKPKTTGRSNPQVPVAIDQQRPDSGVAHTACGRELISVGDLCSLRIESVEAGIRADPNLTVSALSNRPDLIVCETRWVTGSMLKSAEGSLLRIEEAEASEVTAPPDPARAILTQRKYRGPFRPIRWETVATERAGASVKPI